MNGFVDWMGAQAESGPPPGMPDGPQSVARQTDNYVSKDNEALQESDPAHAFLQALAAHNLPARNFPAQSSPAPSVPIPNGAATEAAATVSGATSAQTNASASATDAYEDGHERNPHLWRYRDRTVALLRRYMRLALETGRLPSFIGREMFRARVTRYTATSFEDRVIFVHDVEVCLLRLDPFDQGIIARMILQDQGLINAARLLHCTRQRIARRLPEVLDELTEQFLELKLLAELP